MPRIPDVTSLGERRLPHGRAPEYQDHSSEIMEAGIGSAARQLGSAVDEYADRKDRFRVAKAGASFSTAEASARQFEDNDWETYESRYREAMTKAKEQALKGVRIPANRQALELEFDSAVERGALNVRTFARTKEVEFGRADLFSMLDSYRTTGLSSSDELMRAKSISGAQLAIKAALDNQYIDPTDAEKLNKTWTESYAEGYLSMQPASRRIEMLSKPKGTAIDYIPPDRRAALLDAAKKEERGLTIRRESQAQFDAILAKYGTGSAAIKAARAIEDPEIRDATETRLQHEHARLTQVGTETRAALFSQATEFINGGGTFADLPLDVKNQLKPSELKSLRSYAEQVRGGGKVKTDPAETLRLSNLYAMDPQAFGDENPNEWVSKLAESDYEKWVQRWSNVRSGKDDSGKDSGYRTVAQKKADRMIQIFGSAGPKSGEGEKITKRRQLFNEAWELEIELYKQRHGRVPAGKDADDILDRMTAEVVINWGRDKKAFEATPDDLDIPEADRAEIIRELQTKGLPVTEYAIADLYRYANKQSSGNAQP